MNTQSGVALLSRCCWRRRPTRLFQKPLLPAFVDSERRRRSLSFIYLFIYFGGACTRSRVRPRARARVGVEQSVNVWRLEGNSGGWKYNRSGRKIRARPKERKNPSYRARHHPLVQRRVEPVLPPSHSLSPSLPLCRPPFLDVKPQHQPPGRPFQVSFSLLHTPVNFQVDDFRVESEAFFCSRGSDVFVCCSPEAA